ncbi:DNA-3-methyladenine glycosylase [Ligilactobacillus sp. WILCCON 0076]|uniref:Putative 3-methyladenine DNA glycosylase n=1 Tax=Ligilactobacillus ubinensis TaxID=2876789 RepID=A0A9X2FIA2_9LACO|nr:DNA-3-methyladenine glycosylase [Ligilactobacillus ubinensis]MCP0886120.1 DNA-3-methyladenine glycosylase [Ligilactobacillus ubinensis]
MEYEIPTKIKNIMQTDTVKTAKALLGMKLIFNNQLLGKIVETEAYLGSKDSASHSAGGHRTPKNEAMYLSAGHWYVYQIYGYNMLNFVTRPANIAEAVLIRALEIPGGKCIANGPGKLTKMAEITRQLNGEDIISSNLQLKIGSIPKKIASRSRIGVTCTDSWKNRPLCFYVVGNQHVSKIAKQNFISDDQTWLN